MQHQKRFLVAVAVILAPLLLVLYSQRNLYDRHAPIVTPLPSTSPQSLPEPRPSTLPTVSPPPGIPDNWLLYTSARHGIYVFYPSQAQISNQGALSIRIWGPSQKEGTEMYDGISLSFETNVLPAGTTLERYIRQQASQQAGPGVDSVSTVTPVSISGKRGYQYTVDGLGTFDHIYLEKDPDHYVHITRLVEDPSNQGYEELADQILSSLSYIDASL